MSLDTVSEVKVMRRVILTETKTTLRVKMMLIKIRMGIKQATS